MPLRGTATARLVAALVVAVVTFVVFASCRDLPLLDWDDDVLLLDRTEWRGFDADALRWMVSTRLLGHFQPVTWLSYALDHALWGMDAGAFHTTNVVLHGLGAALLAWCAWALLAAALPALAASPRLHAACAGAAALLWSVHPLRVESVAWATARRDVLSGALLLASLALWLRYTSAAEDARPRRGAYAGSWVLFVLASMAKASAMAWPLVLLLLDAFPLRRNAGGPRIAEKLPFFVAAVLIAAVALAGQAEADALSGGSLGLLDRVGLAGHAASFYVLRTIVPLDLRAHYARPVEFDPFTARILLGTAVSVGLTAFAWATRRRYPGVAVAWFAYLALLAPVSGLVPVGSILVAERYSYLPCIGFSLLVVGGVAAAVLRGRVGAKVSAAAGIAVIAALGWASHAACASWGSIELLFGRVVRLDPDDWLAHGQLGRSASLQGRLDAAQFHTEASIRLGKDTAESRAHLAWVAQRRGDLANAEREARAALDMDVGQVLARTVLAAVAEQAGDLDAAHAHLRAALAAHPDHAGAHHNLALLQLRRGDPGAARQALREALRLDPTRVASRLALAELLERDGDREAAADAYRRVLEQQPGHPGARARLEALTGSPR